MTYLKNRPAHARILPALLLSTALLSAAPLAAQTVSTDATELVPVAGLQASWDTHQTALSTARDELKKQLAIQSKVEADISTQKSKIEDGKKALNAAVLKVAEAKARLAKVDVETDDVAGAQLAEIRDTAQQQLDDIIVDSATASDEIAVLKEELSRAVATVTEMKKAVSAAKAAASAANLVVEAVKSAQLTIAKNEADSGEEPSGIEGEFFAEAQQQAEATQKSAEVAQKALNLTMEREKIIASNLRKTEARLSELQKSEGGAIKAFTTADQALRAHQKKRQAAEDKRLAEVEKIRAELASAETEMSARTDELEADTLARQEMAAIVAATQDRTSDLEQAVVSAEQAFSSVNKDLRAAQKTRDMQEAAILADLNADLKARLRATGLQARADDRVAIPADAIFKARSAKLSGNDAVDLGAVLAAAKELSGDVPDGVDWVLRVDSHSPGGSDESWLLSQARALSLAQQVVKDAGLPLTRVSANGFAGADGDAYVELVLTAR